MSDLEARSVSYAVFVAALDSAIPALGFRITVKGAAPNRMIENWYLADIEYLARRRVFLRRGTRQKNFEGKDGKLELQKVFVRGQFYNEVRHGPQLFGLIRLSMARQVSRSLDDFLRILEAVGRRVR